MTSTSQGGSRPLFIHDRLAVIISVSLVSAAVAAWVASYYLMPIMMMPSSGMMNMGVAAIVSTSSLSLAALVLFEIVWIVGMTAMMFPSMIPVVLIYNRVATKLEENPKAAKAIGTPLFLAGYLASYIFLGLGAYLAVYAALTLTMNYSSLAFLGIIAPSAVLVVTGLYQFSRLKRACLSKCISPLGFFAVHAKKGLLGSAQMGFLNGLYCVGCCWAFMLVMLAVGLMSIPVMAALSGVIAIEKLWARGSVWFNRLVGIGFIMLAVVIFFYPSLLYAV